MNIKGSIIVLYCKTRWTTAYKSIDDVLRVQSILENLKVLGFVLNPLYKAVLALERKKADLSDCYLKLA
ncbi:hypothetical protein RhiirC2_804519 [Rhizophagus irregularis]|uniref:Uncharacterized protein n=1 Tax=Rhizophagus irregularis TaxID=588596 RepID=A0A2N1KYX8_9GLOM|nr:hypothetical protein RhiirC2_804519 [Rhizophagus irregularis]